MSTTYNIRYDAYFDSETGEWLDKIGFCDEEDECPYCIAYNEDGRPENGLLSDKKDWM